MKYMGSKAWMLKNGLGELILRESKRYDRFIDLFSGSGAVSWFVAQETSLPVTSVDLQKYSYYLNKAVIERVEVISFENYWDDLEYTILGEAQNNYYWETANQLDLKRYNTATWYKKARDLCSENGCSIGPVWRAYGGYYFSPTQAIIFDSVLRALPNKEPLKSVLLAATIIAASQCAASPGHTAQPFNPTRTSSKYLRESWMRDPMHYIKNSFKKICNIHAHKKGKALVRDASKVLKKLNKRDLVFIDPPYSGVHYSRFYHVLETIARGSCGPVSGTGRYPPFGERPNSKLSRKSESKDEMRNLLKVLAEKQVTSIITFPDKVCSNGLSGDIIRGLAKDDFTLREKKVIRKFSTLGGNNSIRSARAETNELILLLKHK